MSRLDRWNFEVELIPKDFYLGFYHGSRHQPIARFCVLLATSPQQKRILYLTRIFRLLFATNPC